MSTTHVQCPTCGKSLPWGPESPHRPFCSERCRLLDLGAWVDGSHAIPGPPAPEALNGTDPDSEEPPDGPER